MLRQGFGRLIRGAEDYGVVAILDPRLVISSYGKAIVTSLPEMDTVHSIEGVKGFFDSIPKPVCSEERQIVIASQGQGISLGLAHINK